MTAHLVGVLGGVGPGATAHFLRRLVERTDARCDQDHVRTLAFNDTAIPDRTAFLTGASSRSPVAALIEDGQLLAACGCDLLALPCNTAHSFFDEVQSALSVPLIHMVRETMAATAAMGLRRVGVLATAGTVLSDVYGWAGAEAGVAAHYPDRAGQRAVSSIIFDQVKAGLPVDPTSLDGLAAPFCAMGCDGVVLGCTELSLAFRGRGEAAGLPVIDALDILADRIIEHAGRPLKNSETLPLPN